MARLRTHNNRRRAAAEKRRTHFYFWGPPGRGKTRSVSAQLERLFANSVTLPQLHEERIARLAMPPLGRTIPMVLDTSESMSQEDLRKTLEEIQQLMEDQIV